MKLNFKRTKIFALLFLIIGAQFSFIKEFKYKSGDIIFISNPIVPDKLLQAITKSKISQIGIVIKEKGKLSVYYAGDKVVKKSINEFLALSKNGKYEVLRLKDTGLVSTLDLSFLEEANRLLGFPYDYKHSWLDQEIYSTELIWKIYKRTMYFDLCPLQQMSKIQINDTIVKNKIKAQFGDSIPEFIKIVSPTDLYKSELLVKVK